MIDNVSRRSFIGLASVTAASLALGGCASNASSSDGDSVAGSKDAPTVRLGTTNDGHIFNAIADA